LEVNTTIKPRYVEISFDGWNTIAQVIQDKKDLAIRLKDGSLEEGNIVYEFKAKYKIVKWKDGSLLLSEEYPE
jgi:hypothetical protein